jgi:hypothetical protein
MKITIAFGFALLLSIILGCSGVDKDTVTDRGGVYAQSGQGVSGMPVTQQPATQQPVRTDPESSGGSNLAASAPYAGTPTATQNINGAPFLTASGESAGQQGPGQAPNRLTSRADGTMMSPNDEPAAGIGPGLTIPIGSTPMPSRSPAPAAPKSSKP